MEREGVTVRRLEPEDAEAFRAIRLEGLRLHPEAFGATLEEEQALDLAEFARRLAPPPPGAVFGAFEAGALHGIAGLIRYADAARLRHKATVWGMHVLPEARARGLGKALLAALAAHARASGVELLQLGVAADNAPARALYAGAGYVPFGLEPAALRLGPGRYVDEVLMALDLRGSGASSEGGGL
jgi:ribosomal protein S18 acetylase RimI-like enzyme